LGEPRLIKLLWTVALVVAIALAVALIRFVVRLVFRREDIQTQFWTSQSASILGALLFVFGVARIWFDQPGSFAGAAAIISAGIAVALQKLITSFAAYFIILRGRVFNIGDRITMGGVRGDVISLGFIRTTIMEMGVPPDTDEEKPDVWVEARQYTGRVVSVTNDTIFDKPVFNYTRDFPYLWEEIRIPVRYEDDAAKAETLLLEAAQRHTANTQEESRAALARIEKKFFLENVQLEPRVYYRLTDNWIELSLRFVTKIRGIREVKDAIHRDILRSFKAASLPIASSTFAIVGMPKLNVERVAEEPK
jgi:small-conductance mechanosensitive channel